MSEIATPDSGNGLLNFIERAARDPDFSVEKFGELLRMQQELQRERARTEFNAAMAMVEAEIGPVIRDRLNPAVNRKYATLEAISAVARPVYSRHGFAVRYGCDKPPQDGWMRITCTVSHAGGYSETNYLDSPVDIQHGARARSAVQAVGSTISYLRRYLLQMCFNIVLADDEDDDDGETRRTDAHGRPQIHRGVHSDPSVATARPPSPQEPPPQPSQAPPTARYVEQWHGFLDKLRTACAAQTSRQEVVEIGERGTVGNALATGPQWVQREISAILAEAYGRFPEAELTDDELPPIVGEEKLASG